MERIRNLGGFRKGVLLFLALMFIVFTALYIRAGSRWGYEYNGGLLVRSEEGGATVYKGTVRGRTIRFYTSPGIVSYVFGEKESIKTYTFTEDPSAIPAEYRRTPGAKGIELRSGDELLFRGAALYDGGSGAYLVPENGESEWELSLSFNGGADDPWTPSVKQLVELEHGPKLSRRGKWGLWVLGTLFCLLAAACAIFPDELFRFGMRFYIRGADEAEPSDWELMRRHIAWAVLPVCALVMYIIGLLL